MERALQVAAVAGCTAIAWLAYDRLAPGAACDGGLASGGLQNAMRQQARNWKLGSDDAPRPSSLNYTVADLGRGGWGDLHDCQGRWSLSRKQDDEVIGRGTVNYTVATKGRTAHVVSLWTPDETQANNRRD